MKLRLLERIGAPMVATLWVLGVPGLFVAAAKPSSSPTTAPSQQVSTECLLCHGDPAIIASTGEQRPGLYVQAATIRGSVHSGFSCVACHSALTPTMHAKRDAARSSCARCHTDEAALLAEGAHGDADAAPKLACVSCHGNHAILDPISSEFRTVMTEKCRTCHAEMSRSFAGGNPFGMETHLGRTDVATCWDCHRAHLVLPIVDPRSPVNPSNILNTCRKCHPDAPPNFADIQIHVASSPVPRDPRLRAVTLYMLLLLIGTFAFFGWHTVLQIRHELRRRRRGGRPGSVGGVL